MSILQSIQEDSEFVFVTGPLEGCLCDGGGLWRGWYQVEDYNEADTDMRSRFDESGFDDWDDWLNSWEVEEK